MSRALVIMTLWLVILIPTGALAQTGDCGTVESCNRERIIALENRQITIQEDIRDMRNEVREINNKASAIPIWITIAVTILGAFNYLTQRPRSNGQK